MRLVFWMAVEAGLLEDDKKEERKKEKEVYCDNLKREMC